jgi:putative transposase
MPWRRINVEQQRYRFIRDWLRCGEIASLCRTYEISRPTAYKWIDRFEEDGRVGLADRPPVAQSCPHALSAAVRESLIDLRRAHPTWGPKKLVAIYSQHHPKAAVPAPSTVGDLLRREGLVKRRGRRQMPLPSPPPGGRGDEPNSVWCVDYKGQFRLGNGRYCYPLTVSDECTRYLLACDGFPQISGQDAQRVFTRLFHHHGLPARIRSDNGSPFASAGVARLSRLSVWWIRLGIVLDRNLPSHPEHNGRHERMHRDLKAETTRPPERTFHAQQRRFDRYRLCHNNERPHEALDQTTPASHYRPSVRSLPNRLPAIEYPAHYEVRRIRPNGCIHLFGESLFLARALAGEDVGLVEVDDAVWSVHFAGYNLGSFDRRKERFLPTG